MILSDHLKSLDWRLRDAKFAEKAPDSVLADVTAKLKVLVG